MHYSYQKLRVGKFTTLQFNDVYITAVRVYFMGRTVFKRIEFDRIADAVVPLYNGVDKIECTPIVNRERGIKYRII